jgi:hypothetical protein
MEIEPTLGVDHYCPWHKCHALAIEKVKMLFPHKEHERYWNPLFLKFLAQDVYQDIAAKT